jgi:hypothetical protein
MFGVKVHLYDKAAPRARNNSPLAHIQREQEQDIKRAGKVRPEDRVIPQEGILHKAVNPEADDPNRPKEVIYRRVLFVIDGTLGR